MLDVILQILSVLGIILLVLLAVLITVLLLVLFFPVVYRVRGMKDTEHMELAARADWLFGLLRLRYAYPEPGKLTVKLLWITVYDSSDKREEEGQKEAPAAAQMENVESGEQALAEETISSKETETEEEPAPKPQEHIQEHTEGSQDEQESDDQEPDDREPEAPEKSKQKIFAKISEKITKLKYTIKTIYDKIKRIWQNISYYMELLNDEDTKLLLSHAKLRLCKIIKSIRPRKLKADILFGTGAPDTTGYAYGVYGMLMPFLGSSVVVTPDFQQAVLEGRFQASGRITLAVLLWQALRIALDKKLWQLLNKLKRQSAGAE